MRKGFLGALAALAGGLLLLAGVVTAGRWTAAALRANQSYTVPFESIDCPSPEGQSRDQFLAEVQFVAGEPDRLDLLDEGLPARLAAAFGRHPWVAEVKRVAVLPGRRLRIELHFRQAVLAVRLMKGEEPADGSVPLPTWAGTQRTGIVPCRAVDQTGVLLPVRATLPGLPIFNAAVRLPSGGAGSAWGDPRVEAAARAASLLAPHRERLGLTDADWGFAGDDLVLARPRLRVVWGRAPGHEAATEAPAAVKVRRLLEYADKHGGLAGTEHDVRPAGGAVHSPFKARPAAAGGEASIH
jgi:hypothetical protein